MFTAATYTVFEDEELVTTTATTAAARTRRGKEYDDDNDDDDVNIDFVFDAIIILSLFVCTSITSIVLFRCLVLCLLDGVVDGLVQQQKFKLVGRVSYKTFPP